MAQIRVLLIDDHPIVRSGIRNLIENSIGIEVIGEASNGSNGLELIEKLQPDVVLLDMELPDIPGNEVALRLRDKGSTCAILALSAHDDRMYIQELLSSGAAGYLMKEEIPEFIVDAIRGVARGERGWLSRKIAAQMTEWMQAGHQTPAEISSREKEVLKGVVDGKTNQEIAFQLGISVKTVEKHLDGLFTKLGVASRVEAAVMAVREGWF
ncbi:MAG TPA: response regulator transcription factor [Anaerolineales bacterium]|nr:response regulator transcription factor [Anaerolineales bacterium]